LLVVPQFAEYWLEPAYKLASELHCACRVDDALWALAGVL